MSTIRPFDPRGNFTMFHNYVIDHIMPSLPPNTWKVLCYLIRKTKGWSKDAERLSYPSIREGTGIRSDTTLSAALKQLFDLQYISVEKGGQWDANIYVLNTLFEVDATTENEVDATSKSGAKATTENGGLPTPENGGNKKKELLKKELQRKGEGAREDRPTAALTEASTQPPPPASHVSENVLPVEPTANSAGVESSSQSFVEETAPLPPVPAHPLSRPTKAAEVGAALGFRFTADDPPPRVPAIDPRRLEADELFPAGQGANAYEVYREAFAVVPTKLQIRHMRENVTDLDKWRLVTQDCALRGFKTYANVFDVYLNGRKEPQRDRQPNRKYATEPPAAAHARPDLYAQFTWKQ